MPGPSPARCHGMFKARVILFMLCMLSVLSLSVSAS
jgi:hypothetical protein